MHSVKMTSDQKFWKFIFEDDLDFYEKYTINLLDEDQKHFLMTILILCWIIL